MRAPTACVWETRGSYKTFPADYRLDPVRVGAGGPQHVPRAVSLEGRTALQADRGRFDSDTVHEEPPFGSGASNMDDRWRTALKTKCSMYPHQRWHSSKVEHSFGKREARVRFSLSARCLGLRIRALVYEAGCRRFESFPRRHSCPRNLTDRNVRFERTGADSTSAEGARITPSMLDWIRAPVS